MSHLTAPGRSSAPAVWVVLVVVGLLVLTASLGRPIEAPTTGGAGWLPPDGHRQRFAWPDGVRASEWAIDSASVMLPSSPSQFAAWFGVTEVPWKTTLLARLSTVRVTPAGRVDGRSDDLFSIGADGVRAEVVSGFDGTSLVYLPGRLGLPDDLAAGRSWSSEGSVLVIDAAGTRSTAGYRADYSAATPTEGALLTRA